MAEGRPTEDAIRAVQHVFFRKIKPMFENKNWKIKIIKKLFRTNFK